MKKITLFFLSVIFLFGCQDESNLPKIDNDIPNILNPSDSNVEKGIIRVKLKEEPKGEVAVRSIGNQITTGIRALDGPATVYGITRMERTFPPCGKYEERTRREGLHLWYDVYISEEVSATRAADEVAVLEGIDITSTVPKIASRSVNYPFDDPYLTRQWNFHNPGTESWQVAGADIRLFDVWEKYNGHPDIIISVVDEGVDYSHRDLNANMWINEKEIPGNGIDDDENGFVDDVYGFNFYDAVVNEDGSMSAPDIYPESHGTHVAGIIGAVNNNTMGVAGIAGGNGSRNSGVKIMTCQILKKTLASPNAPAGIKYGADNGAVISQNSWGYNNEPIDKPLQEAIDYFVKYAGCDNNGNQLPKSPMKGGIVIFSAANRNTSDPLWSTPADYEKVIGVSSIGPDYIKASYSAFGDFIDISAPGGISSNATGIYSTSTSGNFMYLYGTSMASPHVSGVAALIIQKYGVGKPGFTASRLQEILLGSAYEIDSYNPEHAGLLGAGGVNAYKALYEEIPEFEPFTLETNIIKDGKITFTVNPDYSGQANIVMYNSMGIKVIDHTFEARKFVPNTLDISALAPGQYNFEYTCNGNLIKEKLIKY